MLANLSPAKEATSKAEVEIEKFLQEQKSNNTRYRTKSDLNAYGRNFCESLKESRGTENIPANELDLVVSKFFSSSPFVYKMSVLSWIVSQVHPHSVRRKPSQYLQYNTAKCLHSPTNPASGNFCRSAYWQIQRLHIQHHHFNFLWWSVKDLKAKWELIAERSRHKQALLTLQLHFWSLFINCCFNHKLFHWACMKNFVFIHWQSLCKSGTLNSYVSVKSKLQHLPPTPSPPRAYPRHLTPLASREERIWLSESSRGWEFELHPQFHVKSLAWWAVVEDVVLEDFRGKDCAFEANWLRVLCRIWRYLNFNIFNIGFSLWINECIKLCL